MPRPSSTATSAVVAGKSGAQDGTVAKAKPALRPLHFIPPLLVALAHLYYLVSQREKVFNMFITSGGSTAAMTSWTEAFGFSIGYILVVVLAVKILKGKGTKTLTPEGKEVVSGPVIYDPREAMIVYNIYMVLMSLWMGVEMYGNMIKTDTFFWNRHMDRSPAGAPLAYAVWVNYISKPTEYFDTLFFLLRGNLRQVSFLHVSHHAVMPVMIASAVLEYPGGNSAFGPGLNSFVHVFMYLYYLLTGLGISMPLFIKKSITVIQLVQFGLISCQALYLLADGYFKYWNTKLGWMAIFLMVQMFSLFGNFFRTAYGGAKAKKVEGKNKSE